MWYEGKQLTWEEPNRETQEFFEANEDITPMFEGVDSAHLWADAQDELDEILDKTKLPWIDLGIDDMPHEEIFEEANHLLYTSCYTLHRPNSSGWLSLCMYGMSSVHTNVPEDYNLPDSAERDLSDWTDIAKFAPRTKEWMMDSKLYDVFTRVRFMAVLPGGWLAPHTDRPRITGVGATNVAVNNPDGCKLVMGGWGELPYIPGSAFKINTGYEHAVWNRSDEPRIHMIFDGDQSDLLKEKARYGYGKSMGLHC